jgi:capsular exopolysaccharide synthesis family protein
MDNLVLQAPTNAQLISPNRKLILIGTVILSIMISMVYLLIKYLTFNEIHNPDELKKLLPSSVGFLGLVPKVETEQEYSSLIVHQQPKSALAESCRHIRSNLQFVLDDKKSNILAVSSSISGEGKTFAALNLAGIFTLSGKKVLVIDLDLRKPKVHHGFGVENSIGMSNILAQTSDVKWKDCVNNSEIEGLDFITAGPIPPNPSELIIGGELDKVLEEFKEVYDLILIDNPPVGIVSDGIYVLNKADCPIYVFRANYSKRFFTERVRELVESNKLGNLFVILNGMEMKRKAYGYAYGYGYGEYYMEDGNSKKKRFWKRK